ncbi:MAG TPA: hypothetical protein VFD91_05650 [Mariniphaga sp.]|nr:hypothetical protein [Mariniphaga sp.]
MKDYFKMKLWGVSFYKPLFKEELKNVLSTTNEENLVNVLIYCYNKYSDMHPEVLEEVFSEYRRELNKAI